ncbi:tRNA lysidine(34) synthetase TilS [Candidatus Sumerlaeota bacterium]|nr:tRNA lysidine(34) synthetase TilS [Candidatus Sumerlaeota bacterium]
MARRINADAVAVAHHKNDLAETILLQLLRGSGRSGLIGFAPRILYEGIRIVRPFYDISREQILQFLKAIHCEYRIDSSNEDRRYLRNRIRLELIPMLASRYNPNIIETLHRTAELLADEDAYLDKITAHLYETLFNSKGVRLTLIPVEYLDNLPVALLRRLLRRWIMVLLQHSHPPSMADIESVVYLIKHNVPGKYHLVENRLLLYRDYSHVLASEVQRPKKSGRIPQKKINALIRQTLLNHLAQLGYTFISVSEDFRFSLPLKELKHIKRKKVLNLSGLHCTLRTKKPVQKKSRRFIYPLTIEGLSDSVELRTPAKGDVITLRGGTKSLSRYLVDRKIPSPLRPTLLLLCHRNRVLWIPGVTPSKSLPPVPKKGKIIYFELQP